MPRTLSSATVTATAQAVTRPFYVAQLDWDGTTYRLSTGASVSWNGYTWDGGSLSVEDLRALPAGGMEGTISLTNADGSAAALVLNHPIEEVAVALWTLYGDGPYAAADGVPVFTGVVDAADLTATRVRLTLTTEGRRRALGPRIYAVPPLCNHLPAPGSVVVWSGERYTLVARRR